MGNVVRCRRCGLRKSRDKFGTRSNKQSRTNCLSCEEKLSRNLHCAKCDQDLSIGEFPRHRRNSKYPVCNSCSPVDHVREANRKLRPHREYWCSGCERSLSPDWFDIQTMRGDKWVLGVCRSCKRESAEKKRYGADLDQQKLRDDMIYDFDLARNMFGMSYPEAVAWLERGYGVDQGQMYEWGITETRKAIWEPDVCD